ncbi:phosphodiesterase [Pseudooceanicola sp. 216_PA32_1]|uniref:Phosphodiesterase n=1 Tax=Pseudooceanicola pacificus TaxID=2676438 RepID=A0A844WEM0_9RHOB|nr:metallophosphoesterase [Pseudooceanicola pacificus]MWB79172.1 phosphodiesterase [Pseudooceanicola pacificus]
MARDITFIHLTDLHIGSADDPHLHSDTEETMAAIQAEMARVTPRPDFIVASGDLSNAGDVESYRRLKAMLDPCGVPVVYALGNHDTRASFYEGMLGRTTDPSAPYDHDRVIADLHIITLDSTTPGAIGGALEPAQFDWLEGRLATHPDLRRLIVVHHAPALGETAGDAPWRELRFEDSQRLAEMLLGQNVVGMLCGHIHHDRFSSWHGIPVIVGQGQHAATDILATEELRMVRGGSFGVGTLRPSGLTVALVPLPSDRAELNTYPLAMLRDRALARDADAMAAFRTPATTDTLPG